MVQSWRRHRQPSRVRRRERPNHEFAGEPRESRHTLNEGLGRRWLERASHPVEHQPIDHDQVIKTLRHAPAIRSRLPIQLPGREAAKDCLGVARNGIDLGMNFQQREGREIDWHPLHFTIFHISVVLQ
jgi:hypothetical protein